MSSNSTSNSAPWMQSPGMPTGSWSSTPYSPGSYSGTGGHWSIAGNSVVWTDSDMGARRHHDEEILKTSPEHTEAVRNRLLEAVEYQQRRLNWLVNECDDRRPAVAGPRRRIRDLERALRLMDRLTDRTTP